MSTLNALLISTMAGMSTLLGGIVIFLNIKEDKINKFISLCLAFSIAIMIGISLTDLIPSSFFNILLNYHFPTSIVVILLSFLFGIVSVIIINKLMNNKSNSLYKLGILSMIALMLHNFPEGIATFIGSIEDVNLGLKLSLAIMFHNIPEGISIAVPIYYATKSKKKALFNTFLSGLAEPLGAFLAFMFLKNYINDLMISIVLLFVAGIMITLSINEMLPKALSYKENKFIYLGLIIGVILILLNHFIF
ncbi:MAG: ZIP family metal transporter [Bacilli bacterium]|nr:ZIP family metal transporter [Bacilli bacterium]